MPFASHVIKHPITGGFVIAIVLSIILAVVLPYSAQEAPWALLMVAAAFPFVWFIAFVIIGTIAWWRDTMSPPEQ